MARDLSRSLNCSPQGVPPLSNPRRLPVMSAVCVSGVSPSPPSGLVLQCVLPHLLHARASVAGGKRATEGARRGARAHGAVQGRAARREGARCRRRKGARREPRGGRPGRAQSGAWAGSAARGRARGSRARARLVGARHGGRARGASPGRAVPGAAWRGERALGACRGVATGREGGQRARGARARVQLVGARYIFYSERGSVFARLVLAFNKK